MLSSAGCDCAWAGVNGATCGFDDGTECNCACCCRYTGSCKFTGYAGP
eukprot:gene38304-13816_t